MSFSKISLKIRCSSEFSVGLSEAGEKSSLSSFSCLAESAEATKGKSSKDEFAAIKSLGVFAWGV
jgi:hypothetical protein